MSVLDRVLSVLANVTREDEVKRNPDVHLFETGLLDSFGVVELMLALEAEFGTAFSPAEFDPAAWATPNLIARVVAERVRD